MEHVLSRLQVVEIHLSSLTKQILLIVSLCHCRWDCSFQYGSLVEEVDGHTAILYHRLQLDWCTM